jgi:hypothetical protein
MIIGTFSHAPLHLRIIIGYISNGRFGPFQRLRFSVLIVGHGLVAIFEPRI